MDFGLKITMRSMTMYFLISGTKLTYYAKIIGQKKIFEMDKIIYWRTRVILLLRLIKEIIKLKTYLNYSFSQLQLSAN